jgi:hypothetical protein
MNKINIADLFAGLQNQMVAQLNTNREFILHSGTKGDSLENVWIEWLRKYLPNKYCVDKAIVVDSEGNLSQQLDLVIYDQIHTPFVFTQNGVNYIPAEGVYAVFEVKPDFEGSVKVGNKYISYIEYAGKKIESVRKLKRTSVGMINSGVPVLRRPFTKIIGGILASTNSIKKTETVKSQLKSLKKFQTIDIGCAVEYGSFYVNYKGEEDTKNTNFENRIADYYSDRKFDKLIFSSKDNSLITFFLQLTRYLQQAIGTVAAIDLDAYAKNVAFKIDDKI